MEEICWRNPSWVAVETTWTGVVVMVLQGVNRDRFEELALGLCLPQALLVWEYSEFFGRVLLWSRFFSYSYLYVGWEPLQKP